MIYFAWINNHTDRRDDDVLKVKAQSRKEAKRYADDYCLSRGGVSVMRVFTRKEFKRFDPGWHRLLWGVAPDNE